MSKEELIEYEEMKSEFKRNSYYVSAISLANIVVVACLFRNFFHYSGWKKFGISVGTFLSSHYSGMYAVNHKAENMCDKYIDKYKNNFLI
jgi:hypothetical protein